MKQSEIKNLSVAELQVQLSQSKKTYTDLKSAHAVSPIANPLQIRSARKVIARIATELSKKELQ